jgi:hypothetical protein
MFNPLVLHKPLRILTNIIRDIVKERVIARQCQLFKLWQMPTQHPTSILMIPIREKQMKLSLHSEKGNGQSLHLRPKPLQKISDSIVGAEKIHASPTQRSHCRLHIDPELGQFLAQ